MQLRVGTSGFSYREWLGTFYPPELAPSAFLPHYAARLNSVELNNTFYRIPSEATIRGWSEQVPVGFRFAVKASRRITHMGRLQNVEQPLDLLLDRLSGFGACLGCVLFQLPPNFRCDLERLRRFLLLVRGRVPVAMEFRHASWFEPSVLDALREANAALCIGDPDADGVRAPDVATADFVYVRLRSAEYGPEQLDAWVRRISELDAREGFVFFKHETLGPGYATSMAERSQRVDKPETVL